MLDQAKDDKQGRAIAARLHDDIPRHVEVALRSARRGAMERYCERAATPGSTLAVRTIMSHPWAMLVAVLLVAVLWTAQSTWSDVALEAEDQLDAELLADEIPLSVFTDADFDVHRLLASED